MLRSLYRHKQKLSDFQHLCMLVLCEVLSLGNHSFVTEAQQQFFAVNESLTGEISFIEFVKATHLSFPAGEVPSEEEIKFAYEFCDKDLSDDITWSEWQVGLAYSNQLTEKNLRNVYQYLNLKNRHALKIKHLHAALKPHIFRLKLKHGQERDTLERIIAGLADEMQKHGPLSDQQQADEGEQDRHNMSFSSGEYHSCRDEELITGAGDFIPMDVASDYQDHF